MWRRRAMAKVLRSFQGINYEVFTPDEPHAGYKKMLILGHGHWVANDFDALVAHEFAVLDFANVRYECTPHRGLVIKG